ncbi:hypothetical protein [Streptomyces sp. NPDC054829]
MPTPTSQSTVAVWTTGVLAMIPPVLAAAAGLLLHSQDAERVAQLAAVLTALITAGVPVLHRSTGADCRRAADDCGHVTHLTGPLPRIVPSATTVALSLALGVAAFWLLYLLSTWLGLGSLGYWSGEYPSDPSEVYRKVALRGLPVLVPGVFAIGVAMAHRLHGLARPVLLLTSVLFTVSVLVSNAVLVRHRRSEPLPEDVYVPLLLGALAWLVCLAARAYAARTQRLFDLMQAVRLEYRRTAEPADSRA